MDDYGVNWDAGKQPPLKDECEYPEHGKVNHCRCCGCYDCRMEERCRFEDHV